MRLHVKDWAYHSTPDLRRVLHAVVFECEDLPQRIPV